MGKKVLERISELDKSESVLDLYKHFATLPELKIKIKGKGQETRFYTKPRIRKLKSVPICSSAEDVEKEIKLQSIIVTNTDEIINLAENPEKRFKYPAPKGLVKILLSVFPEKTGVERAERLVEYSSDEISSDSIPAVQKTKIPSSEHLKDEDVKEESKPLFIETIPEKVDPCLEEPSELFVEEPQKEPSELTVESVFEPSAEESEVQFVNVLEQTSKNEEETAEEDLLESQKEEENVSIAERSDKSEEKYRRSFRKSLENLEEEASDTVEEASIEAIKESAEDESRRKSPEESTVAQEEPSDVGGGTSKTATKETKKKVLKEPQRKSISSVSSKGTLKTSKDTHSEDREQTSAEFQKESVAPEEIQEPEEDAAEKETEESKEKDEEESKRKSISPEKYVFHPPEEVLEKKPKEDDEERELSPPLDFVLPICEYDVTTFPCFDTGMTDVKRLIVEDSTIVSSTHTSVHDFKVSQAVPLFAKTEGGKYFLSEYTKHDDRHSSLLAYLKKRSRDYGKKRDQYPWFFRESRRKPQEENEPEKYEKKVQKKVEEKPKEVDEEESKIVEDNIQGETEPSDKPKEESKKQENLPSKKSSDFGFVDPTLSKYPFLERDQVYKGVVHIVDPKTIISMEGKTRYADYYEVLDEDRFDKKVKLGNKALEMAHMLKRVERDEKIKRFKAYKNKKPFLKKRKKKPLRKHYTLERTLNRVVTMTRKDMRDLFLTNHSLNLIADSIPPMLEALPGDTERMPQTRENILQTRKLRKEQMDWDLDLLNLPKDEEVHVLSCFNNMEKRLLKAKRLTLKRRRKIPDEFFGKESFRRKISEMYLTAYEKKMSSYQIKRKKILSNTDPEYNWGWRVFNMYKNAYEMPQITADFYEILDLPNNHIYEEDFYYMALEEKEGEGEWEGEGELEDWEEEEFGDEEFGEKQKRVKDKKLGQLQDADEYEKESKKKDQDLGEMQKSYEGKKYLGNDENLSEEEMGAEEIEEEQLEEGIYPEEISQEPSRSDLSVLKDLRIFHKVWKKIPKSYCMDFQSLTNRPESWDMDTSTHDLSKIVRKNSRQWKNDMIVAYEQANSPGDEEDKPTKQQEKLTFVVRGSLKVDTYEPKTVTTTRKMLTAVTLVKRLGNLNIEYPIINNYYFVSFLPECGRRRCFRRLWEYQQENIFESIIDIKWHPLHQKLLYVISGNYSRGQLGRGILDSGKGHFVIFELQYRHKPLFVDEIHVSPSCIAIHPTQCKHIALGLANGELRLYNMGHPLKLRHKLIRKYHIDICSKFVMIEWETELKGPGMSMEFYSCSYLGHIHKWRAHRTYLEPILQFTLDQFFGLTCVDLQPRTPSIAVTCVTFHPKAKNIFLVGIQSGYIFKCDIDIVTGPLFVYNATMGTFCIQYNRLIPEIFASYGPCQNILVWKDMQSACAIVIPLIDPAIQFLWAPFSSTVIITIHVKHLCAVDLYLSATENIAREYILDEKSNEEVTKIEFCPKYKYILCVGTNQSNIFLVKIAPTLRGLERKTTFSLGTVAKQSKRFQKVLDRAVRSGEPYDKFSVDPPDDKPEPPYLFKPAPKKNYF